MHDKNELSSENDIKCWPHSFEFCLRVSLAYDGNLSLLSHIRNINGKTITFSFSYPTYFSISDISEIPVERNTILEFFDNLLKEECFSTEQGHALTFEFTVDCVNLSSPKCSAVLNDERKRTHVIKKDGMLNIIVRDPWEKKEKTMQNFGDGEFKRMFCVDSKILEYPMTLKSGKEWIGFVELAIVPSTFCNDVYGPCLGCRKRMWSVVP